MKEFKIILITSVIILVFVWSVFPWNTKATPTSTPTPTPTKKTVYAVVDKQGNEIYKIIKRDE